MLFVTNNSVGEWTVEEIVENDCMDDDDAVEAIVGHICGRITNEKIIKVAFKTLRLAQFYNGASRHHLFDSDLMDYACQQYALAKYEKEWEREHGKEDGKDGK